LFKEGLVIPEAKVPTFAEFSKGWWDAVKAKIIKTNPCGEVKRLKKDVVDRDILTIEEVKKLFHR
jgi:hypothetical protein